ncbi:hypothetical protein KY290_008101 [Solanum tuberosum]|uniref:Uncharacterized protein n=1 Tax=Solanum tuberosum TaxID=4113 RepID=A0ABQ7W7X6_SOLTU|nr:hypothetical protein KY290_008101 [Solanum tuberosum]
MAKAWEEQVDLARSYLDKAAQKMKKFSLRGVSQSLIRRYEGPFEIIAKADVEDKERVELKYSLLHQPWTNRSRQLLIINWFATRVGTIRAINSLSIGKKRHRRRQRGRSGGACATPKGATLNFSISRSGADSYRASTDLEWCVNYIPALGDNLETLGEQLMALTISQNGFQERRQD